MNVNPADNEPPRLRLVVDNGPEKNSKGFPIVDKPKLYAARKVSDTDDATPERLAMSPDYTITTEPDGTRTRQFQDELLVRMASKGQLYPDKETNAAMLAAGIKYHEDWYGAGMGGLQAIDYGKVSGGQGGSGSSMPASRIAAQHRADYRAARAMIPSRWRKPLEAILLEGQSDLVAIGKAITGAASPHTARSVTIERFTTGLYLLARHYRLI